MKEEVYCGLSVSHKNGETLWTRKDGEVFVCNFQDSGRVDISNRTERGAGCDIHLPRKDALLVAAHHAELYYRDTQGHGRWPRNLYRVAPGGTTPSEFVVVPIATQAFPSPPCVARFSDAESAQAKADELNNVEH